MTKQNDAIYVCTCETPPHSRIATLHEKTCAIWLSAMYQNELAEKRHLPPSVGAVLEAAKNFRTAELELRKGLIMHSEFKTAEMEFRHAVDSIREDDKGRKV